MRHPNEYWRYIGYEKCFVYKEEKSEKRNDTLIIGKEISTCFTEITVDWK